MVPYPCGIDSIKFCKGKYIISVNTIADWTLIIFIPKLDLHPALNMGFPRVELGIFIERIFYSGYVPIML